MNWRTLLVVSSIVLPVFLLMPLAYANDVTVPTTLQFGVPEYSGYISFDEEQTFDEVKRESSYWYFDEYGFQVRNANMSVTNFFEHHDELEFTVSAASGITSTSKVYVGTEKGRPHKVFIDNNEYNEGNHWTYDGSSETLTVTWTHSSPAVVKVKWKGGGLGLFNLDVKVTKDGLPTWAYVRIGQENRSVFATTTFQLPYGIYTVTAVCGSVTETKQVGLFSHTTVGFNFHGPKPSLDIPWQLAVPFVVFFVAILIFLVWKRGK